MRGDRKNSLFKKKYFDINNSKTGFCSLYVELITVQI